MKLELEWMRPLRIRRKRQRILEYEVDLHKLPKEPGIYVFGRRYGKTFEALYVGKADKIYWRVRGQLNNLKLMRHVQEAKAGKRLLLIGRFISKPGQKVEKCLPIAERSLIRHFLSEGHDLVNKQGTRLRRHELMSIGKHPKRFFPKTIYLER